MKIKRKELRQKSYRKTDYKEAKYKKCLLMLFLKLFLDLRSKENILQAKNYRA